MAVDYIMGKMITIQWMEWKTRLTKPFDQHVTHKNGDLPSKHETKYRGIHRNSLEFIRTLTIFVSESELSTIPVNWFREILTGTNRSLWWSCSCGLWYVFIDGQELGHENHQLLSSVNFTSQVPTLRCLEKQGIPKLDRVVKCWSITCGQPPSDTPSQGSIPRIAGS